MASATPYFSLSVRADFVEDVEVDATGVVDCLLILLVAFWVSVLAITPLLSASTPYLFSASSNPTRAILNSFAASAAHLL